MGTERERIPLARPSWPCPPNVIMCSEGHPLLYYTAGFRAEVSRLFDGNGFFECHHCQPNHSYFLASASKQSGISVVTCYDLSRDDFTYWDKHPDEPTPPLAELLYAVHDRDGRRHNPYFIPPKVRRNG